VATVYAFESWLLFLVAFGLWRLAEITVWYTKLLLDRTHSNVLPGERDLVFLVCDMGAFVTVLALLLVAGGGALPSAWADALSAFTLNGRPDDYTSSWASVSGVLGAVGGGPPTWCGPGRGDRDHPEADRAEFWPLHRANAYRATKTGRRELTRTAIAWAAPRPTGDLTTSLSSPTSTGMSRFLSGT
jgi:hypothetical protein